MWKFSEPTKKFCQQKVEIPRTGTKKSLSLPLTLKMVEYRSKEEQRRGKKTIMRRWRELLEKWNRKREGVQNEAKGENTGIAPGEQKWEQFCPTSSFFIWKEKKEVMV
ncbi:MAG: hypothetical protein V2G33_08120 [bacterium JZ-2024 1]